MSKGVKLWDERVEREGRFSKKKLCNDTVLVDERLMLIRVKNWWSVLIRVKSWWSMLIRVKSWWSVRSRKRK